MCDVKVCVHVCVLCWYICNCMGSVSVSVLILSTPVMIYRSRAQVMNYSKEKHTLFNNGSDINLLLHGSV